MGDALIGLASAWTGTWRAILDARPCRFSKVADLLPLLRRGAFSIGRFALALHGVIGSILMSLPPERRFSLVVRSPNNIGRRPHVAPIIRSLWRSGQYLSNIAGPNAKAVYGKC